VLITTPAPAPSTSVQHVTPAHLRAELRALELKLQQEAASPTLLSPRYATSPSRQQQQQAQQPQASPAAVSSAVEAERDR
jgi:hypothetical protein